MKELDNHIEKEMLTSNFTLTLLTLTEMPGIEIGRLHL